ncbi:MAG: FtsX-like permease family protein [Deltaproteobacteria bacterium]|nr:FtsX-like permease family protein [Deltaproteobacteria bacterium]
MIEKQIHLLDFTLASLLRRKGRNAALILVYTLVVFLLASVTFFTQALKQEAARVLRGAPELIVQRLMAGRQELVPASYAEALRGILGVHSVRGRLWGYYFDPVFGANYTLMVPEQASFPAGTVVVGPGLTRSSLASLGNLLPFRTHRGTLNTLEIGEILPKESELVAADLVLVTAEDFRAIFGMPEGYFTDLVLGVRNPNEVLTVAKKVLERLPDTRPVVRDEILRTYESVFNWRSGVLLFVLLGSVLAFAILAWDKASGLSEAERREIAILKAVGWETGDVIVMKSWEGMVVSLSSFVLGLVLAYVHVFFGSSALLAPVLKGWSVLYPEFRLAPLVDPYQVATLFFLCVVPYTVATVVPVWRAATVDPDSVMRS